jgi:hypothetical protein
MFLLAEDKALKSLLQGITVIDEANAARPVQVWYGFPDVELRQQTYPYMTIDLIDIRAANNRQQSGLMYDSDNQGTIAEVTGVGYSYEFPVTYDIIYQVTSYARNPQHDRSIIYQVLNQKLPNKYGFLPISNELGTEIVYRHMFLDEFIKRDYIEEGRRTLRNVFTVRVLSNMSHTEASELVKEVAQVSVNSTTSYIPSGLTIVPPFTNP